MSQVGVKWGKKCVRIAESIDDDPLFCHNEDRPDDAFEDDGFLHVVKNGTRAVFNVGKGQSLNGIEQNKRTRIVMEGLGLIKKLSSRVLVDEEADEEDDCCPECGRAY